VEGQHCPAKQSQAGSTLTEPSVFLADNLNSDSELRHTAAEPAWPHGGWPFAASSDPPAILQRAAR
jgi:hypothetical protein